MQRDHPPRENASRIGLHPSTTFESTPARHTADAATEPVVVHTPAAASAEEGHHRPVEAELAAEEFVAAAEGGTSWKGARPERKLHQRSKTDK